MSLESFDATLQHLGNRWQDADKKFLRHLFPLIAKGKPVQPGYLADITGMDIIEVDKALTSGRTSRDENGDVTELFGISLYPAYHRIKLDNIYLYSCCPVVAMMVASLVDQSITIESMDPTNKTLVKLDVSRGGIRSAEPHHAVGTLVVTDEAQVLDDVSSAFCSHVHLFSDTESAQQFVAPDPRRYVVTIGQLHDASRKLFETIWVVDET